MLQVYNDRLNHFSPNALPAIPSRRDQPLLVTWKSAAPENAELTRLRMDVLHLVHHLQTHHWMKWWNQKQETLQRSVIVSFKLRYNVIRCGYYHTRCAVRLAYQSIPRTVAKWEVRWDRFLLPTPSFVKGKNKNKHLITRSRWQDDHFLPRDARTSCNFVFVRILNQTGPPRRCVFAVNGPNFN